VVREMNRVGIMVDVSHLSDDAIWDVLEVAKKPLIATHSACRHFTPGFERNLSDSLIRAIAKTNGVVQVPFSHYFLSTRARKVIQDAEKALKDKGLKDDTSEGRAFIRAELARANITVRDVADHIDYLKKLVGINYIGLGGDFDGVGLALPPDLSDVGMYPNLIAELLRRGYSESDIKKICYQNVIRVWKANE
jgi:membrane dipeptidase